MISEKDFEDILCKYPELIETNLTFQGRQMHLHGKIIDILFTDKFNQNLIIELKIGAIDRKHIGQIMEYEGSMLSVDDPTARVMLVGNRVPPNLKKALDHHGIEWRELPLSKIEAFLEAKGDIELLKYFQDGSEISETQKRNAYFKSAELSRSPLLQSNVNGLKTVEIKLTRGSLKNNYIRLSGIISFFPKDVVGGTTTNKKGREILIKTDDGTIFYTDIAGDKKIFRNRGQIGRFLQKSNFDEGDIIVIKKINDYEYFLAKKT